mmetsp:Transcript_29684/g.64656  ORF Transcript_29684/g.64656 Transcript_29684/m.64656 type:complete len:210 (+) Transcript_29684:367-996(+)
MGSAFLGVLQWRGLFIGIAFWLRSVYLSHRAVGCAGLQGRMSSLDNVEAHLIGRLHGLHKLGRDVGRRRSASRAGDGKVAPFRQLIQLPLSSLTCGIVPHLDPASGIVHHKLHPEGLLHEALHHSYQDHHPRLTTMNESFAVSASLQGILNGAHCDRNAGLLLFPRSSCCLLWDGRRLGGATIHAAIGTSCEETTRAANGESLAAAEHG